MKGNFHFYVTVYWCAFHELFFYILLNVFESTSISYQVRFALYRRSCLLLDFFFQKLNHFRTNHHSIGRSARINCGKGRLFIGYRPTFYFAFGAPIGSPNRILSEKKKDYFEQLIFLFCVPSPDYYVCAHSKVCQHTDVPVKLI